MPLMQSLQAVVFQANPDRIGEVIFVDDGSDDRSFEELCKLQSSFKTRVTIIKLTRNFGQASALLAGWQHAKGECVITMSADGQEPPELINDMLKAFFNEGYETVICERVARAESSYRIVTSRLFYYLMRKLTFTNMPKGGFDFWLVGRRPLETLLRDSDVNPFFQGHLLWMGYRTKFLSYRRRERLAGISQFTFGKKVQGLLAGVLEYSFAPIRIMSLAGCTLALCGFVYAGLILINRLAFGNPVKGWAPLMIMVLVLGGCQMIMLGIMGEYLWRTLAQVRRRDMYLIDAIYDSKSAERAQGRIASQPLSSESGNTEAARSSDS